MVGANFFCLFVSGGPTNQVSPYDCCTKVLSSGIWASSGVSSSGTNCRAASGRSRGSPGSPGA